jgi:hypothetical protein
MFDLSDPFGDSPVLDAAGEEWMQLTVVAPPGVVSSLIAFLQAEHDFVELGSLPDPVDWCALERPQDLAHADYAPCPPIVVNTYGVDWRKGEGRGDVVVEITDPSS